MVKNKVYTREEIRLADMDTSEYAFMDEAGEYIGRLELKAEARSGMLRVFFLLEDGRKIITPVFWWQKYLGFYEMNIGIQLKLIYAMNSKGSVYLKSVACIDQGEVLAQWRKL